MRAWALTASGKDPNRRPGSSRPIPIRLVSSPTTLASTSSSSVPAYSVGQLGGQPVRLDLNVPTHNGAAAGTIAGIPASATWKNGDNYYIYPDVPSELTGSFAGLAVELHATFHLEPGYFFDHGTISGHVGAEDLDATVETASGGLGGTGTVAVDGTLGSTEFTIYAAIDGPLTSGRIRGTVAGNSIRIDAARTRQPEGEQTRLTGSYEGPRVLYADRGSAARSGWCLRRASATPTSTSAAGQDQDGNGLSQDENARTYGDDSSGSR